MPGAQIKALVTRTPANAEKLIQETQLTSPCAIVTDLSEALRRPDVDVVIITTPSGAHMEPAIAAANAGKHVIVEKPLEITAERCDRIIDACERNGVQLCTIFPSRFHEANIALKKAVETRRFGRLTLGETTCKWWRSQAYYDEGGWKGTQALDGGGALMNQAIHNVDLLLWMMGKATQVSGFTATLAHERIEVEDTAVACLRFTNGALGVIQAATSVHPGLPKTIAVHGDRGSAVIEQEDIRAGTFSRKPPKMPRSNSDLLKKAEPRAVPAIPRRFPTRVMLASWPILFEQSRPTLPPSSMAERGEEIGGAYLRYL